MRDDVSEVPLTWRLHAVNQEVAIRWVLRIGVAATFLGHGMFAWSVHPGWVPYLMVVGFSAEVAAAFMPAIGVIDFVVAACVLVRPLKIVLVYAVAWTFVTALIRPIAGESLWAFVERGANWAAPLALLLLQGVPSNWRELFQR